MIHTQPQSTYAGSQAPLSQVWLRAPGGAALIPGLKFFDLRGYQATTLRLSLTPIDLVVGPTPKSLATLFDEAMALAGVAENWATEIAPSKAVGCVSEAIVGGDVQLARGISHASAFPASSEVVPAGRRLRHGPIPEEGVGGVSEVLGSLSVSLGDASKAEDSVHASGDRGMFVLAVRSDAPGSLVSANGDYAPLQVGSQGRLRSASAIEQPPATVGAVNAIGESVEIDAVGMGAAAFMMTVGASVVVQPEATLDGVNWAPVEHWTLGASSSSSSSPATMSSTSAVRVARLQGFSRFRLRMTGGSAATLRIQPSAQAAVPTANISGGGVQVAGSASHGVAVAGTPVMVAAEARAADQTALAQGQTTRQLASLLGKLLVLPYALPGQSTRGLAGLASSAEAVLLPAQAGLRHYLTTLVVSNPTGAPNEVIIKDGATEVLRAPCARDSGGAVVTLPVPLRGSLGAAISAVLAAAPTGTISVTAVGFTASE